MLYHWRILKLDFKNSTVNLKFGKWFSAIVMLIIPNLLMIVKSQDFRDPRFDGVETVVTLDELVAITR